MKLRVYLDTSVVSALLDKRNPDRQKDTQAFWRILDQYEVGASELTRQELLQALDSELRARFLEYLEGIALYQLSPEMYDLAYRYLEAGVFAPSMFNDALHVAAAVCTRHDILVSWNFKHLVNRRRRAQVNQVNVLAGLPPIDIVAPPEI